MTVQLCAISMRSAFGLLMAPGPEMMDQGEDEEESRLTEPEAVEVRNFYFFYQ